MRNTLPRRLFAAALTCAFTAAFFAPSALAATASTSTTADTTIQIGDKTYDSATLQKAKSTVSDKAKELPAGGELPQFASMEDLVYLFSEMGIFYTQRGETYEYDDVAEEADVEPEAPMAMPVPRMTTSTAAGSASSVPATDGAVSATNTQVAGVDEGDIVKTDGKYIYYASRQNGSISIVSVNGKTMTLASTIKLDENTSFSEMYVKGDRLVVVSSMWESYGATARTSIAWRGTRNYTRFEVYNIADRAKPTSERKLYLAGNSMQTRMVDDYLYFVVQDYIYSVPYGVQLTEQDILPAYSDSADGSGTMRAIAPTSIRIFPGSLSPSYMLVGGFNITDKKPCVPQAYLGNSSDLYMTPTRMYVAQNAWEGDKTNLFRFNVSKGTVTYSNSGQVDGHVLNQYAMDEYGSHFRIATTTWPTKTSTKTKNHLFVLDKDMNVVGSVRDMAPDETIQSVRFTGDTGYIVTYRRTDPLFVLDLKTPTKPRVLGELKVPGFSSYLHPVADGVVVGIGRETTTLFYTDANGKQIDSGQEKDLGLKLSMFDVKNPRDPKQMFVKVLGNEYTNSEVSYNARALMVDMNRGVLGIPVHSYDWTDGKDNSWWGAYVVAYNTKSGFTLRGELKANKVENNYYFDTSARTCYIGDTLYMVSGNKIYAYNFADCKLLTTKTLFTISMDQSIAVPYAVAEPVTEEVAPIS